VTEQHGRRGLVGTPRDAAICASERPAASCAAGAVAEPQAVGDGGHIVGPALLERHVGLYVPRGELSSRNCRPAASREVVWLAVRAR
jgi:hypothetical protein